MKGSRLLALCVCFGFILIPSCLLALFESDLSLVGSGDFTIETVSLQKGSGISVETDLQDIAAIIVEDLSAGKELVRIGTERIQRELQLKKEGRPESTVVTDADSLKGQFQFKTAHDLTDTKALRITLILANGMEVPFTIESRASLANRRITRTFEGKACTTYSQTCRSDTSPTERCSKTCCSTAVCYECFPCTITCGPCDWEDDNCASAPPPPQQTIAVSLDGKPRPVPKSSFVLGRMEPGNNVSFLMDEWAVAVFSQARVQVLKASSPAFASAISKDLSRVAQEAHRAQKRNATGSNDLGEPLLIVEAPVHPHNSRFVPPPTLTLSDAGLPAGTSPGRALIRADFSEEEDTVGGLQILYGEGSLPQSLLEVLRDRLTLDRLPTERHRTVVFARVNIADALEVTSLASVLPKCCCGGRWCV